MKKRLLSLFLVISIAFTLVPGMTLTASAADEDTKVDSVLNELTLIIGDTSCVMTNFDLPDSDDTYGTTITWSSSNVDYLWEDGTVIRPPSGKDITVTLTATVSLGEASKTKDFIIGIPAYDSNIRVIDTVHKDPNAPAGEFNINVPVGTCPKLPYRVWVTYNDGYGEWRQTQWPWSGIVGTGADRSGPVGSNTAANQEEIWKGYAVGTEYTVTGWIIGDNATNLGYPITVNCTVVDGIAPVPDHNVAADTLPMSKVTLIGENRLTSNSKRAVTAIAGWDPDTYLYNYRETYGLPQPEGATPATGWEAPTSRLRGHGAGHFIDAMALAYVSGQGTEAERKKILNNLVYMIDELRKIQEMTFVKTGEDDAGNPIYREGSNVWPYYAEDKAELAPDWPFALLSEITSPVPNTFVHGDEGGKPEWFGYGYLHATPPLHPVLNEAYRPYSAWTWAPYYSVHKQLAGFMDVYYALKDNPETRPTAEKALMICRDMSRWISNRLTTKCRIEPTRDTTTYGNLNATWYANISGEYGGVNESIARCAYALPDDDPVKELLLRGSEMFDNKSYWDPLAVNSEIMWNGTPGIGGNSHANQRIPQMPGVLWSYRGNGEPRYYNIAKNFFDFSASRFRYYGGNVGVGEWYNAPFTQIGTMTSTGNETCCATNMARLSKDLACFEPDNAEYMDYYERVMYNQLVGSLHQNEWSLTYQYALGPNTAKPTGNDNPGSTCCGGTGSENHVRYTDATYFVSDKENKAIWVNLYMPTQCVWDAAGVTLTQDCRWPAESSKITVASNAGETQKPFAMHLRVPYWATKGFDIKLNGVSIADTYGVSFAPSSYVVIPEREWSTSDVVEITCPLVESIDYGPDRKDGQWAGVIFYGPLAMAGKGNWSTLDINYDLSNIIKNGYQDLPDTSATTPGNNHTVYSMSVTGQSHSNADILEPDYYTGLATTSSAVPKRTLYYKINMIPSGDGTDRTGLYNRLQVARAVEAGCYSPASFAALQAAIEATVAVYQDTEATQTAIDTQVGTLQAAIDNLVLAAEGKAGLLELINTALGMKAAQEAWEALPDGDIDDKPCAPYGYARMLARLGEAQAVYENAEATMTQVNAAHQALDEAMKGVRRGYMPEIEDLASLNALLTQAKELRANSYSLDSYLVLLTAIARSEETVTIVTAGSSTINQETIPNAIKMLQDAIDGLVDDYADDKENLWENMNYTFFSGDSDFCLESEGNYVREGALIDLQAWSSIWNYQWRLTPDDNHEYFQLRRQSSKSSTSGTVLGPYGAAVEAGTVLVMVHGNATDDTQWWKPMLQDNGQYIIVNKANPTLCIALRTPPAAANGRVELATLDSPHNTWRILGATGPNLSEERPALPLEKKIVSVAPLADIVVPIGTPISEIALPARISVTYEGNSKAIRNIVWDISAFNGQTLTGTIALDGIETNPDDVKASIKIVPPQTFVPVTDITGVPTTATAGIPLMLIGTVVPDDATNKTIAWSVQSTGDTGAVIIEDNILSTTAAGIVIVRATIINGLTESTNYTQDFPIEIVTPQAFVPVTDIAGVPTTATAGIPLTLTGTVVPDDATNKTIAWSVQSTGDTGAVIIEDNILSTTAAGIVIVRATIINGLTESTNYTQDFSITVVAAPIITYIVTASAGSGGSINPSGAVSVKSGGSQTFTITPNSGYRINFVTVDGINQGTIKTYTFTSVTANHTINATFTRKRTSDSGDDSPSTPITPTHKADVDTGNSSNTTLPVTVDNNSVRVDVGAGGNLMSGGKTTVITVPFIPDVDIYMLVIPVPSLSTPDEQGKIAFKTDNGSVTVSSNMLTGIEGISGSKAQISVGQGDKSSLSTDIKAAIGDRPLIQLTLFIDGKQTDWNNANAPVTVSIPYIPTADELKNPESIVIWYIDGSGNAVSVPNGRYDPATGTVTFFTTHFSNYAITYVNKTFSDLGDAEWARKAIEVMAAKGITNGTDNDTFSPAVNVTRADYIALLIKTLGFTASFIDNFDDVKPGAYYYEAVGIAKKLDIATGTGNGLFKPTDIISRQDMMVLTARALEKYQGLKAADNNAALDRFNDKSSIADYAISSLATLVNEGLIEGSGNNINPRSYTTRAEAAVFLYNIYNKYPNAPTILANTDV